MAVYVIGDVQGCMDDLWRLLERIRFEPMHDTLWFAGDLVNRGPDSLAVLRFVRDLGPSALTVLGNHDLHLLAVACGATTLRSGDTLDDILAAPDRDELMHWLRRQPLLHHDAGRSITLVHAGVPPQWDIAKARACAAEVEAVLGGDEYVEFFNHMYGNEPDMWSDDLAGWDRLRFITNCLTRLRYCDVMGRLALKHKLGPGTHPDHVMPWFAVPGRRSGDARILFGHWSTLGVGEHHNVIALDGGCVWGGQLVAVELADPLQWHRVACVGACLPGGES